MKFFIRHELKCRFCGKVTGTLDFPPQFHVGKIIDDKYAGIVDVRCDICEAKYGKYKDMEVEYKRDIQNNHAEFLAFMEKAQYKKVEFDKEIIKLKKIVV